MVHIFPSLSGFVSLLIGIVIVTYTLLGFNYVDLKGLFPWILSNSAVVLFFGLWAGKAFELISQPPGWSGFSKLLFVALCMVTADTGAYFTGKSIGKHKLCPGISPKKTIEGLIGGILCTLLLSGLVGSSLTGLPFLPVLILGFVMSLSGTIGDLIFSSLKRYGEVKDSSNLIPGHGGVVDRFDSLFYSIPIAVIYFNWAEL